MVNVTAPFIHLFLQLDLNRHVRKPLRGFDSFSSFCPNACTFRKAQQFAAIIPATPPLFESSGSSKFLMYWFYVSTYNPSSALVCTDEFNMLLQLFQFAQVWTAHSFVLDPQQQSHCYLCLQALCCHEWVTLKASLSECDCSKPSMDRSFGWSRWMIFIETHNSENDAQVEPKVGLDIGLDFAHLTCEDCAPVLFSMA